MQTAMFFTKWFRDVRIEKAAPHITGDVLDLACGPGLVLARCKDNLSSYHGVELDPAQVERLRREYPDHEFTQMDLDEPVFDFSKTYDVVVMLASIGLLGNQLRLLKEIHKVLKPGGRLVMTTPTPFGDWVLDWGTRVGLFSEQGDQDKQIAVYNRRRTRLIAERSGFTVERFEMFELLCNQLIVLCKK